jgi:hypothetical protein
MTRRTPDGNSWTAWYSRQRSEPTCHDDPNRSHVNDSPTCSNCGSSPEASADPIPERCPECWARLQAAKS